MPAEVVTGDVSGIASMRAWRRPIPGLWPETGKNRRKIEYGLTGKMGKKSQKKRKNGSKIGFLAIFPIFGRFFPYFPGEAKSIFRFFLVSPPNFPGMVCERVSQLQTS